MKNTTMDRSLVTADTRPWRLPHLPIFPLFLMDTSRTRKTNIGRQQVDPGVALSKCGDARTAHTTGMPRSHAIADSLASYIARRSPREQSSQMHTLRLLGEHTCYRRGQSPEQTLSPADLRGINSSVGASLARRAPFPSEAAPRPRPKKFTDGSSTTALSETEPTVGPFSAVVDEFILSVKGRFCAPFRYCSNQLRTFERRCSHSFELFHKGNDSCRPDISATRQLTRGLANIVN